MGKSYTEKTRRVTFHLNKRIKNLDTTETLNKTGSLYYLHWDGKFRFVLWRYMFATRSDTSRSTVYFPLTPWGLLLIIVDDLYSGRTWKMVSSDVNILTLVVLKGWLSVLYALLLLTTKFGDTKSPQTISLLTISKCGYYKI